EGAARGGRLVAWWAGRGGGGGGQGADGAGRPRRGGPRRAPPSVPWCRELRCPEHASHASRDSQAGMWRDEAKETSGERQGGHEGTSPRRVPVVGPSARVRSLPV